MTAAGRRERAQAAPQRRRTVCAAVVAVGHASCGNAGLAVPSHPHPDYAEAQPVGFPPPPAQIEELADTPPRPGCLWTDGQWVWTSQRWDWRPGQWVQPPQGCRYSAASTRWVPSTTGVGVLYHRPARWYSMSEPRVCPDPPDCTSPSPPNAARVDP